MSHFSLLVRVPAYAVPGTPKAAVSSDFSGILKMMLAPYCEDLAVEFEDTEDEDLNNYQTKTTEVVRLADGRVVSWCDNECRNPNYFAEGFKDQYIVPPGATKFEMALKDRYPTFEEYQARYCGKESRDVRMWRYGYWHNPKAKWDWWGVGGRWDGFFEKFAPAGNFTRISDISWRPVNDLTHDRIDKFWSEWQEFCAGKDFGPFDGPSDRALQLGLIQCCDESELTGNEWKVIHWDKPDTPEDRKRRRCDVLSDVTKLWLVSNWRSAFSPLQTWARLDSKGWTERGKMCWFACADDTVESNRVYCNALSDWLNEGDQDDWLVVVDCHI